MHFLLSGSQESPNSVWSETLTHLSVAWSLVPVWLSNPQMVLSLALYIAAQLLPKAPQRTSPKDWLPFLHAALSLLVPETPTSSPDLTLTSSREWDCCVLPGFNLPPREEKSPQAGILPEHRSTIMYFPSFKDYTPAFEFSSFIVVCRRRHVSCTHHSILVGVRNSSWINSGDQWLMNTSLFPFIYMFWNIFNIVYSSCNVTVWIKWTTTAARFISVL